MNDLGLTLAWLAVQVAILLAPTLAARTPWRCRMNSIEYMGRGPEPRTGCDLEHLPRSCPGSGGTRKLMRAKVRCPRSRLENTTASRIL